MASVTLPSSTGDVTASPKKRNYARIAEKTWIWSIVGYSTVRFLVAWGAFSEHGANIWLFGLLDVGTAWPYAKAVAEVCKRAAHSRWAQLPGPLVVALSLFFLPYAYLWFAAGEMPSDLRVGMAICVSVLLLAATAGVLSKTRKIRQEESIIDLAPNLGAGVLADADLDTGQALAASRPQERGLVIDLRDGEAKIERPQQRP